MNKKADEIQALKREAKRLALGFVCPPRCSYVVVVEVVIRKYVRK